MEGGRRGKRRVRSSGEEVRVAGEREAGEYQPTRFERWLKLNNRLERGRSREKHVQKVEVWRNEVEWRSAKSRTTRLERNGRRTNEEEAFDR